MEQEKKLKDQEGRLVEQEKKLKEQEERLEKNFQDKLVLQKQEFEGITREREEQLLKEVARNKEYIELLGKNCGLNYKYTMEHFRVEKAKNDNDWKSPAMYTYLGGYKFRVGIQANGYEMDIVVLKGMV